MNKQNKIIFFGVKEVGLIALKAYLDLVDVAAVITIDSGENIPLKDLCSKFHIPIYMHPNLKNINFINKIKSLKIDTGVVVSYPKIIPEEFFKIFSNGIYNFHPAKLPNFRGCFPTIWPILNEEKYAYYTIHLIDKGIDTGPIVSEISVEINKYDTGWSLYEKLTLKLPILIKSSLALIFTKNKNYIVQNINEGKYYPKSIPNDGLIDFSWNGKYIVNFVKALYSPSHLSAYFIKGKEKIELVEVEYLSNIDSYKNRDAFISCSDGFIKILNKKN